MPSWNDGETSTDSLSSESEGPMTIYDSDFCGLDGNDKRRCDCPGTFEKFVAFESSDTGRRFLGCSCVDGFRCGAVEWIDPEWPMSLKKALWALWKMYEDERDGRKSEAIDTSFKIFSLSKEKEELEKIVHSLQSEIQKMKQVGEVSDNLLSVHKLLRSQAEKERDDLKGEKKKLEYVIADLMKAGELNKGKLKKIQDVLFE